MTRRTLATLIATLLFVCCAEPARAMYNSNTGRFWSMDSYEGSSEEPLSLHKYLYAHANPVMRIDPSGMFTQRLGYEAEAAIQIIYLIDHPGDVVSFGKWTRLGDLTESPLFKLKPDILNVTSQRWAEIKPLSISGIASAGIAVAKYGPLAMFGFYPDVTWTPSTHFTMAGATPIFFFNAGGIIFYTDQWNTDLVEDALAITTYQLARRLLVRQTLITAVGLAGGARTADGARLQEQLAIASMLALLGGF